MKLMMQKWCWIGLILCASGTAWAAKGDNDDKPASNTKKSSSDKADSKDDSAKDDSAKDDSAKDDSAKDDAAEDEEVEAPKPPPRKAAAKEKEPSSKSHNTLNLGALVGYGTSPFTRLGIGLRGGMTLGGKEGPYVGIIGTYFLGTSVSQDRITGQAERTRKTIILGAEGGYDMYASKDFLVRPYMSLGMAIASDHTCAIGTCWDDNGVRLTIAPGAQAIYTMDAFYLGGDLRYQIILNKADASAAVLSLILGLSL